MIVERRTFQAKVGLAGAVVAQARALEQVMSSLGQAASVRVYTDYFSGRTDRVVMEWDIENFTQYESQMAELVAKPEATRAFETWFAGLTPLIEGASVEFWHREE